MITNGEYIKDKTDLARNIKDFREDMGFTQQQMADALCVDRSTYAYYETAKTLPDIFTLIKIAKIFNINIIFLFLQNSRNYIRSKKTR